MTSTAHGARRGPLRWIASYPILFGMLLCVPLLGAVVVVDTWFPGVERGLAGHGAIFSSALLTFIFFAGYLYFFWPVRKLPGFWAALGVLFAAHAALISLYSLALHPLFLWQWSVLGFLEAYALGLLLAFLAWRREQRQHGAG